MRLGGRAGPRIREAPLLRLDDNGDLIFNDRPAAVGRNTLVTPAVVNANVFVSHSFTFGPSIQLPPGIQFGPGAGQPTSSQMPRRIHVGMSLQF